MPRKRTRTPAPQPGPESPPTMPESPLADRIRPATLDEISSALEFLLRNEYVTGQTLVIDGGYSLLG